MLIASYHTVLRKETFLPVLPSFYSLLCLSLAVFRDRAEQLGLMLRHGWLVTVCSPWAWGIVKDWFDCLLVLAQSTLFSKLSRAKVVSEFLNLVWLQSCFEASEPSSMPTLACKVFYVGADMHKPHDVCVKWFLLAERELALASRGFIISTPESSSLPLHLLVCLSHWSFGFTTGMTSAQTEWKDACVGD